jgi:hypothetical protein
MAVFSSASIQKCHDGTKGLSGYDREQTRVMGQGQEEWQNRNIDKGHTHAIELVYNRFAESDRPGAVRDSVMARIREAQGDKTIRKDAVLCLQFYATMPDYSRRSADERERFEWLVRGFLGTLYGDENIADMRWHFDESAPHIHATVVPVTADGRLCCKEVFRPTKRRQEKWQRDYYEAVAKPMGYDAPDFGHANEKGYTKSTAASRKQAKAMEERRDAAVKAAAEAQERQAVAEGLASEQLDAFVKASSKAAKAERERDALAEEVAAIRSRQVDEQRKLTGLQDLAAEKAGQVLKIDAQISEKMENLAEIRDETVIFSEKCAAAKAAADAEADRLESVRRAGKAADARVEELRERVAAARAAAGERSPQPARQSVTEDARTLFGGRNLKAEEEQLRSECDALERRRNALRDEVRELGFRIKELVSNIETFKDRVIARCREGIRVDRMPRALADMVFNLLDKERIEGRMRAGGEWASVTTGIYAADTSKRQQACAEAPRWEPRRERGRGRGSR